MTDWQLHMRLHKTVFAGLAVGMLLVSEDAIVRTEDWGMAGFSSLRDESLLWRDGRIPPGKSDFPVTFITIMDACAFCRGYYHVNRVRNDRWGFRVVLVPSETGAGQVPPPTDRSPAAGR